MNTESEIKSSPYPILVITKYFMDTGNVFSSKMMLKQKIRLIPNEVYLQVSKKRRFEFYSQSIEPSIIFELFISLGH